MSAEPVLLAGDEVENPGNRAAIADAARLFACACGFRFRDREPGGVSLETLAARRPLVVVDNVPRAQPVYDFRLTAGPAPALVVGNERRGVTPEVSRIAHQAVEIPMVSRRVDTLNVAAAAAVALYYALNRAPSGAARRRDPEARRPELMLAHPRDHVEAGSSIRSAAALGWRRLFIEDVHQAWFAHDRARVTESRAAARRARNAIHVVPVGRDAQRGFRKVVVAGVSGDVPLRQVDLAGGPATLVVIPDGDTYPADAVRARVELPVGSADCRYRLLTAIVLAEISRQVGVRARGAPPSRRRPVYELAMDLLRVEGEIVSPDDLVEY